MAVPRRVRSSLKVAHLVTAVGALGVDAVIVTLAASGALGGDPRVLYPAAVLTGSWLLAPAAVAALVTGLLLVFTGPYSVRRDLWVLAKLLITTGLGGAVFFGLVPRLRALAEAAGGPLVPTPIEQAVLAGIASSGTALLLVSMTLAVFKPNWPRHATPPLALASRTEGAVSDRG